MIDNLLDSDTKIKVEYIMVYEVGDANGDGKININDVVITERIILGFDPPTLWADAKQDRKITIADVVTIERIILGLD